MAVEVLRPSLRVGVEVKRRRQHPRIAASSRSTSLIERGAIAAALARARSARWISVRPQRSGGLDFAQPGAIALVLNGRHSGQVDRAAGRFLDPPSAVALLSCSPMAGSLRR